MVVGVERIPIVTAVVAVDYEETVIVVHNFEVRPDTAPPATTDRRGP
jgi:hypothetical protein